MKLPQAKQLPSGNWLCRVTIDKKTYCITRETEKQAVAEAVSLKAGLTQAKKKSAAITLGDAIDRYIALKANLSPSTLCGYQEIKRNRFKAYMDKDITKMQESDWQIACNDEALICSPKTLKNAWSFVSAVLYKELKTRYDVTLPDVPKNKRNYLDPQQIKLFVAAVHGKNIEIPALLALCSLRRSEILGLRWSDIDIDKNIVLINGASVVGMDHRLTRKDTNKNETSQRAVPILIPQLADAIKAADKSSDMVVKYSPNSLWEGINSLCKQNGLPLVGVHGLRHSFASLCYSLGVPERIAMEIGGWADSKTMHEIYTHISKDDISKRSKELTDFFSSENAGSDSSAIKQKDAEILRLRKELEDVKAKYVALQDLLVLFGKN